MAGNYQIADQANYILGEFTDWVQANAGSAQIVHDLQQLWQQAVQSSQKPIIYLLYNGEKRWGPFETAALTHRVTRHWIVVLKFGRGYTANRGDTLSLGSQNAPPFYNWIEDVRDIIRCMYGVSQDLGVDFDEIRPMKMGTMTLDAYEFNFSTQNDLPNVVETVTNQTNNLVTG